MDKRIQPARLPAFTRPMTQRFAMTIGSLLAFAAFLCFPLLVAAKISPMRTSPAPLRPGRFGHGSVLLVNGRTLTPSGTQTVLRPMPLNAVMSPSGSDLLVTEDGRGPQYLQLISTKTMRPVQLIGYPAPRGLFLGIAYSNHGRRVFASGGGQKVIHVFKVSSDGHLHGTSNINLITPQDFNPFPAGLAVTDNDRLLLVAQDEANSVAIIRLSKQRVVSLIPVGERPYAIVARPNSPEAYVSNWASTPSRWWRFPTVVPAGVPVPVVSRIR